MLRPYFLTITNLHFIPLDEFGALVALSKLVSCQITVVSIPTHSTSSLGHREMTAGKESTQFFEITRRPMDSCLFVCQRFSQTCYFLKRFKHKVNGQ